MNPIRVLVVDDSALMRKHISSMLDSSPRIEVCGLARNGQEAVEQAAALAPDVITLDVDMPGMSGLETIPAILEARLVPIVMVSSLTQHGAEITFQSLSLGAVDFVTKPDSAIARDVQKVRDSLVNKIIDVAGSKVRRPALRRIPGTQSSPAPSPTPSYTAPKVTAEPVPTRPTPTASGRKAACVVIGISTGGPPALHEVLERLVPPFPPIVIVQHMPEKFTGPFAKRLDSVCPFRVAEAAEADIVTHSQVLIANGGKHLELRRTSSSRVICRLNDNPPVAGHKPSVDVLFESAAEAYRQDLVGVIMTGMGRDGVDGCKTILAKGGKTYGQDQATSVVYGMNKIAFREGGVQKEFALDELASILSSLYPS